MKVLLIVAYFPPDTSSAAHLFYDLGNSLVQKGYEVFVVTSFPYHHPHGDLTKYKGKVLLTEELGGMKVIRTFIPQFPRHIPFARGIWQFITAAIFSLSAIRIPRPDISIVYSPPLTLALTAWWIKRLWRSPFILNVQDLFPQSAVDLGVLKNPLIIRFFEGLERLSYRKSKYITVHSQGNRDHVIGKGTSHEKVIVLPNWVNTDLIKSGERMNGFRKEQNVADRFIISFAGEIGYSQDLDVVLDAANILQGHKDILFLVVGGGVEKNRLENKAIDMGLKNVKFLPMQDRERYIFLLQASDISLATLRAEVTTPVVPSKILSIMASGRPVIVCMNLDGDAPKIIKEARCGYAFSSGDFYSLADAILRLYHDRSLLEELGQNGRDYCERYFSLHAAVEKYTDLLAD